MSSNNDIYIDENEDNIGNKTFNTVLLVLHYNEISYQILFTVFFDKNYILFVQKCLFIFL